jgi:hypothetical protein
MSPDKPQPQEQHEMIARLRQAWRHAEIASNAIESARQYPTQKDLMEGYLIQASEETKKTMAEIEEAATLAKVALPREKECQGTSATATHGRELNELCEQAQAAVDELFAEKLIPFKLTAHKLEPTSIPQEYRIEFSDLHLASLFILWRPGHLSFKKLVREGVVRQAEAGEWNKEK